MTEPALVDPELQPVLGVLPPMALSEETLLSVRELSMRRALPPPSENVDCEEVFIDGFHDAPPVRILVFRPRRLTGPVAAILHIHGGGYVMGNADMDRAGNEAKAEALNCIVVAVDYRLAPETQYPGPLEDCYAALCWMHEQADQLGLVWQRIGVAGSSAGAGLAAALALFVRDRGEVLLAFLHLIAPMIDDRTCLRPVNPHVGQYVWTVDNNRFGWRAFLGHEAGEQVIPAYAAAARAENLVGLPPTYIAVGALDLFLEEDLSFAGKLAQAGVPVELHVYPGAFHGFLMVESAGVVQRAMSDSFLALARFCSAERK